MEFSDNHASNQSREGIELIQPCAPELGDLGFGDRHTAEEGEGDDDEGVEESADEWGGRDGCDHLAEGYGEKLGYQDHEELVAGSRRGSLEAGHVVEGEEEADCAKDGICEVC